MSRMYQYRLAWMYQTLLKQDRISDVRVISSLTQSATFFASTTVLIAAAIISLLGYADTIVPYISKIPFASSVYNQITWYMKCISLLTVLIYTFFKFTWAIRQYNYTAIVFSSTPVFNKITDKAKKLAERNTKLLTNAARHADMGMRGYYFAIAMLSWFISDILFIVITTLVILILLRRSFKSRLLEYISLD